MPDPDQQMGLPLGPRPGLPADDFAPSASNQAARRWLVNVQDWPNGRLALWGDPASGKSRLARLWCGEAGRLFAGAALPALPVLATLAPGTHIAVDDADAAAAGTALLHLINAAAEAGCPLLLTGRTAPARWDARLPDLASRLRATLAVGIDPPDDALLALLLARALAERQLQVPPSVQAWMLRRLPRCIAAVMQAVTRLDEVSLARQHPITRNLAAAALRDLLAHPEVGSHDEPDDTSMMSDR